MPIPKIIHQIWFDFENSNATLSKENLEIIHATQKQALDDDVEYKMWHLSDAIQFIETHYPYLTHFFKTNMRFNIVKCDFFRYLLIYHFGGVYLDLDFALVQPIAHFLRLHNYTIILSEEWFNSAKTDRPNLSEGTLHNGCLFSVPRQSFWLQLAIRVSMNVDRIKTKEDVWKYSGTNLLRNMYMQHRHLLRNCKILPYYRFCPFICQDARTDAIMHCVNESTEPLPLSQSRWAFYHWDYIKTNRELFKDCFGVCVHVGQGSFWNH